MTDQFEYLGWLIDLVKEQNISTPKSIISAQQCIKKNKLVEIYHSST